MNLRIALLFLVFSVAISCSKDEEPGMESLNGSLDKKFIGKVLPDGDGYWFITKTMSNTNCNYCSSFNLIDGLVYFSSDMSYTKEAIGYILDAELFNHGLLALTSTKLFNFNKSLQQTTFRNAGTNEVFKLMAKDANGKIWILSNNSIFSLEGETIPFNNTIEAIDFEISKDRSFWIATSDTIFHLTNSQMSKTGLTDISVSRAVTATIYNLSVDKNDDVWVNTSEKVFKLNQDSWVETKAGAFVGDNFTTVPFMDVDSKGNLWLAEKHYQAFTNLHIFDGSVWSTVKLNPPLETWITDIETADPGHIWIATVSGLKKIALN